ncbi:hypothetical protein ACFU3J_16270 [Streptomyces sp. NPDC057411]|uniref:hypothetical protein n=1 Tax=unclassified Streptomyces TaxID=2593676 RepID=UPI00362A9FC2
MSQPTTPYNWADEPDFQAAPPRPASPPRQTARADRWDFDDDTAAARQQAAPRRAPRGPSRAANIADAVGTAAGAAAGAFVGGAGASFVPPVNVTLNRGGNGGGNGGGGGRGPGAPADGTGSSGSFHQGDRLIYAVERIEIRSDRDILALAKAINRLGRELHLILGMRAEEIQGVLSTYKGKWYTFGASSRIRARLVAAHLKVAAEAAKALGVAALKMAHAFDRHFVKPEQEARRARSGHKTPRKTFTIGEG